MSQPFTGSQRNDVLLHIQDIAKKDYDSVWKTCNVLVLTKPNL